MLQHHDGTRSHHSHQRHRACHQEHTPQLHHEVSLSAQQWSTCQSLSHTCHVTTETYQSYYQRILLKQLSCTPYH